MKKGLRGVITLSPCYFWLPSSSTQRTKSVSEVIHCYYVHNNKKRNLLKGSKPVSFPENKVIIHKARYRSLPTVQGLKNPVRTGYRFVEYLKENQYVTYEDLANQLGITKARVCQMIALYKRLPARITDFLMNTNEPEILEHFTERRLRPLTLLLSDEEKIRKFEAIEEALDYFR